MPTRGTTFGWLGVAALVALGTWPATPSAAAKDRESLKVENTAEAWYVSPTSTPAAEGAPVVPPLPPVPEVCTILPLGCPAGPLPVEPAPPSVATAYPPKTLHVQANGGKRTAHSYVVPNTTAVPFDATLVGGTMTLPLTKGDEAGNVGAQSARMIACLTTEQVTADVAGGVDEAPDFGCQKASSKLKFDEEAHAFVVDLTPFIQLWESGAATNYGIALVPALDLGPDATWQVTLNGSSVDKGKRASSILEYELPDEPKPAPEEEPEAPTASPTPTGGGGGGSALPAAPAPVEPAAPAPAAEPPAPAPEAAPVEEQLEPAPFALLNSPWYSYRGVVFLPLAFLIAMGLTGRSLTRPLTRVARR